MSVLHTRPQRRTTYLPVSPLHQASARGLTERLADPTHPTGPTSAVARAGGAVRGLATAAALHLPKRSAL